MLYGADHVPAALRLRAHNMGVLGWSSHGLSAIPRTLERYGGQILIAENDAD